MTNEQIAGAIVMAILRVGDRIETAIANRDPHAYAELASSEEIREATEHILRENGKAPYPP